MALQSALQYSLAPNSAPPAPGSTVQAGGSAAGPSASADSAATACGCGIQPVNRVYARRSRPAQPQLVATRAAAPPLVPSPAAPCGTWPAVHACCQAAFCNVARWFSYSHCPFAHPSPVFGRSGMESSIAPAAGGNVTTKGLAEDIDTFFTGLGNLLSYGLSNVKEVCGRPGSWDIDGAFLPWPAAQHSMSMPRLLTAPLDNPDRYTDRSSQLPVAPGPGCSIGQASVTTVNGAARSARLRVVTRTQPQSTPWTSDARSTTRACPPATAASSASATPTCWLASRRCG